MSKYIVLSEKEWHKEIFENLKTHFHSDVWLLIDSKTNFSFENIKHFEPDKIFIPHWSYIIPASIYNNYCCIVFHMTDLPFGRGGSPLQNLISRGYKSTKISALKVQKGIDTGDIYLKKELKLDGTASEIFKRAAGVIEDMISDIINQNLSPIPQTGEITEFKRRKPEESNLAELNDITKVYDYIRMLDCEGYPYAFLETKDLKFEFNNAGFDETGQIVLANVRISKK